MRLCSILLGLILSLISFKRGYAAQDIADTALSPFDQGTCQATNKDCRNACENTGDGSTCCYCDDTMNIHISVCSCCPKDTICCPPTAETKTQGSRCCPVGTTCKDNGMCERIQKEMAVYGKPTCAPSCPKDTYMWITCDNYFTMYLDGKPVTLNHAEDWTLIDQVLIPRTTKVICIAGENTELEAGFLIWFKNAFFDDSAVWMCTHELPDTVDWMSPDFDESNWKQAVLSEYNTPKTEVFHRVQVKNMSEQLQWFWSNKGTTTRPNPSGSRPIPWYQYCFCRLRIRFRS